MSAKPEAVPVYPAAGENDGFPAVHHQERRRRQRTQVHWQVRFSGSKRAVETTTRNLSSDGFYCLSSVPLQAGEPMSCTLRLPAHDSAGRTLTLQCRIRIVRVEPVNLDGVYGIGCRIEDYHFVHTDAVHVH